MHIEKKYLYLTFLSLVIGLIIAQVIPARSEPDIDLKNAILVDTVKQTENEISRLEQKLSTLRSEVDKLQQEKTGGERNIRSNLQDQQELAGLTEITSEGIIITIDDNTSEAENVRSTDPASYQPNDYIVHDKNLLYLVNELRAAGARAVSINEQRIVTTTDIRCVGTVITINATRIAPPFEIKALGNPDKLEKAIKQGREYQFLKDKGFPFKIETADKITVPPYNGSYNTDHLSTANIEGDADG